MLIQLVLSVVVVLAVMASARVDLSVDPPEYGVDCSTPIHWGISEPQCKPWKAVYEKIMKGCASLYSKEECDQNEHDRLVHSREQPATQHNYTTMGFKKMKAPKEVWEPLLAFYNKYKSRKVLEKWYHGATIVNTWDSPTYMVSFENADFPGGLEVKQKIWDGVRPVIEEWIGGYKIEPTSLYGIRIYTTGSILQQHVDRLPLITSCIINVDQDLDEPWPIEVYDHAGKAYNVTMEPGDLVLYESSTVLHGRPFPMKGRHFSNIFVHFQPLMHEQLNQQDDDVRIGRGEPISITRHHSKMRSNKLKNLAADEEIFRIAAAQGNMHEVQRLAAAKPHVVTACDENGWQAVHEAARAGQLDVIKFLVAHGADVNARIRSGGSTTWLAREHLREDHPVIMYLVSQGAAEDGEDEDGEEF